jgi:hypothetical protein
MGIPDVHGFSAPEDGVICSVESATCWHAAQVFETVQPDLKTNNDLVACYKDVPMATAAGVCTVVSIAAGSIK